MNTDTKITVRYIVEFIVPVGEVEFHNEAETNSLEEAEALMAVPFEEGQVVEYNIFKVTTTIEQERVGGRRIDSVN